MGDLLESAEAWRHLHSADAGNLTGEGLLETMLLAGYDEGTSQAAATEREKDILRRNRQ